MIELSRDDFRAIVAEARLAPSVHNIQPTRWRMTGKTIDLLGDPARAIPVADPAARDWWLSHGAALEGFDTALGRRGLAIRDLMIEPATALAATKGLMPIARFVISSGESVRPPLPVETRASWRGTFSPIDANVRSGLDRLAAAHDDVTLIRTPDEITDAAALADRAGLHFLRESAHRRELLHWMRLSARHPAYERDGLNARAMQLGAIEAFAAGLVLGPLFEPLDKIGLAASLVTEAAKSRTAAAIALLHRPAGEHPTLSGRAFYRAWLGMEQNGLKGCPMSVLADWQGSREYLARLHGVAPERQIVSVFRIGRPSHPPPTKHARLPVDELIVQRA
jgi:nitroreductase